MSRFIPPFAGKTANDRANLDAGNALARLLGTHRPAHQPTAQLAATRTEYIQGSHTFTAGAGIRHNGTAWVLANGTGAASVHAAGIVSAVAGDWFELTHVGLVRGLSGLTAGATYYLDASGILTTTVTAQKIGLAISTTELLVDLGQVPLTPDADELIWTSTYSTSGGTGTHNFQAGTQTWLAHIWAGGGGGGHRDSSANYPGGGGGAGSFICIRGKKIQGLSLPALTYGVGVLGAAAGSAGSNGTAGGSSYLGTAETGYVTATGGRGGIKGGSTFGSADGSGGRGGYPSFMHFGRLVNGSQATRIDCWGNTGNDGQPGRLLIHTHSVSTAPGTSGPPTVGVSPGGLGGTAYDTVAGNGGDGAGNSGSPTDGTRGRIIVYEYT